MDLLRDPDVVELEADQQWLCPECFSPYSKAAIEAELVSCVAAVASLCLHLARAKRAMHMADADTFNAARLATPSQTLSVPSATRSKAQPTIWRRVSPLFRGGCAASVCQRMQTYDERLNNNW